MRFIVFPVCLKKSPAACVPSSVSAPHWTIALVTPLDPISSVSSLQLVSESFLSQLGHFIVSSHDYRDMSDQHGRDWTEEEKVGLLIVSVCSVVAAT